MGAANARPMQRAGPTCGPLSGLPISCTAPRQCWRECSRVLRYSRFARARLPPPPPFPSTLATSHLCPEILQIAPTHPSCSPLSTAAATARRRQDERARGAVHPV